MSRQLQFAVILTGMLSLCLLTGAAAPWMVAHAGHSDFCLRQLL